jgi:hypothetical protein
MKKWQGFCKPKTLAKTPSRGIERRRYEDCAKYFNFEPHYNHNIKCSQIDASIQRTSKKLVRVVLNQFFLQNGKSDTAFGKRRTCPITLAHDRRTTKGSILIDFFPFRRFRFLKNQLFGKQPAFQQAREEITPHASR